jgi:hypothetical protein
MQSYTETEEVMNACIRYPLLTPASGTHLLLILTQKNPGQTAREGEYMEGFW